MHSGNQWGGSFELSNVNEDHHHEMSRSMEWDRAALHNHKNNVDYDHLDETQRSWLLGPSDQQQKKKYVDLGCVVCSYKAIKWSFIAFVVAFCVIALPIIIVKTLPKHGPKSNLPHHYSDALSKALLFFNAQKSGVLPKSNNITWRGNSGLRDGNDSVIWKGGLVGGYYDSGENTKYHFPMAYSMTMLSWSVIEYSHKYHSLGQYDHVRDLIKWGSDYLLLTFNSSSSKIDKIYSQVGGSRNGSQTPDDYYCWQKPEDMDYQRITQTTTAGPDLAGEIAAALASASIVFHDNASYSEKLINAARTVFALARDGGRRTRYSNGNDYIAPYYNSTGYYDEYMWGATWLYYATGNVSYISLATNPGIAKNSRALYMSPQNSVPSWNNKLPAAMLLLTRLRIFLNPGYPYEDMLRMYHNVTCLNMCSYLKRYNVFNWTRGGMIIMNKGQQQAQNLQYVANTAFLASLFVDYLDASRVPGWNCGPDFISSDDLRSFATSQIDYILGKNPMKMSYVVGYGNKFPRHVHHRGASTPNDHKQYSCTGGWKWRDSSNPNPHNITGAMVGGPDQFDQFHDVRTNRNYTEPSLAGNAGLVAALVSLTSTANSDDQKIDKNTMFAGIPPLGPQNPPPPPPWRP